MIDGFVKIIWIAVPLKRLDQFIKSFIMQVLYELGYTAIKQFHARELADVGFDHQRIHSPDPPVDLHQFSCFCGKVRDTALIEIYVVETLVVIASLAESGEALVTDRLFFEAGRM